MPWFFQPFHIPEAPADCSFGTEGGDTDTWRLREYAQSGLLVSYGARHADHCRRAATYVDGILKSAKAADLPVQLPTTFELVVNMKTARTFGNEVPPTLIARADEV